MQVKTGGGRFQAHLFVAPTGLGDDLYLAQFRHGAQGFANLKAIHARHTDIEQNNVGFEFSGQFQGAFAIVTAFNLITEQFDCPMQGVGGGLVIIDDQNAQGRFYRHHYLTGTGFSVGPFS